MIISGLSTQELTSGPPTTDYNLENWLFLSHKLPIANGVQIKVVFMLIPPCPTCLEFVGLEFVQVLSMLLQSCEFKRETTVLLRKLFL